MRRVAAAENREKSRGMRSRRPTTTPRPDRMSTSNTIVALLAWYIFNGLFNVENKLILNHNGVLCDVVNQNPATQHELTRQEWQQRERLT